MKIREGFVSNSSSSSFIIRNRANFEPVIEILEKTGEDYYIFNNVLYTSGIYESDYYSELCSLADEDRDGEIGGAPYGDENDYIELEGVLGHDSIWIERDKFTDSDLIKLGKVPYYIASKMYLVCKKFFDAEERSEDDLYDLLNKLRSIYEGDYED